jgi:hypothetical protein
MSSFPAIDYATLARLRAGARSKTADVICPVCSATRTGAAARRKVLRTWVKQSAIGFHCVRCDIHGLAFADNEEVEIPPVHIEDDEERKRRSNLEQADRIWRQSFNITGTEGEAYFARRGIPLDDVPDFGGLRWHPKCPWEVGTAPCVLARFTDAITAAPRGVWRRPIDGGKPKTLGPMRGCVIRLWRDCDVTNGLVLGEGVETVLSAGTRFVHRDTLLRPAWAAGSAGNLENFPVLTCIEALTLLVDHDENGRGQEAARRCGERWQDAGREVRLLTPRNTGDFNDLVRP